MPENKKGFVNGSVVAGIEANALLETVDSKTREVRTKLQELKNQGNEISVASTMEFQMLMNNLMQICEMSNSVFSACHQAVISMLRSIRS